MTVCASGTAGWDEDDPLMQGGEFVFVTLTAPGSERHRDWRGEWCPCTPEGGVDLATWNATSGLRWSRFVQQFRREVGAAEYFKGVEVQKRGAVHFHAVFRLPPGRGGRLKGTIRRIAMHHGFGHAVDAQPVPPHKVAGYIAKYASKATDERHAMPWCDRETGEKRIGEGRYRVWSCSRAWGWTMADVRAQQVRWARRRAASDAAAGAAAEAACAGGAGALDHKAARSTSGTEPP